MRKFDDHKGQRHEGQRSARRHGATGFNLLGMAIILGVAVVSAYTISHQDAPVKPASGAAQAMALASSKPSPR